MSAPQPYFDDGQVSLYVGDCRKILQALGITADLVLADPPYGETSLAWDRWPHGWLEVAAGVSRSLWCFGSLRVFLDHAGEFGGAGWKLSHDVIWRKQQGTGFAADRFRRVHETAAHWYRGDWGAVRHKVPRIPHTGPDSRHGHHGGANHIVHMGAIADKPWTDDGTRIAPSVIDVRNMHRRGAIHPTEKPLGILTPLIEFSCPPGGLVIDPFAGSGSTLDAARLSGRRAIGIEADERYAEKAARRLSQATLFSGEAS